ncbi:MAG: D-alanine--D-alanine ligase [Candidatus Bipolaricaulia bacterium]
MANDVSIGVLAGSDSPEREISLISGKHVHRALLDRGHDARLIRIDDLNGLFPALDGIDVVFNCLHGGGGEDGTVQLFLDVLGIPYAGSGAQACARAMDKPTAKRLFETMRVPTPPGLVFEDGDLDAFVARIRGAFSAPFVVKPTHLGSTIGVSIVEGHADLASVIRAVGEQHGAVLVEPFIAGRELTVGILWEGEGHIALPVVEIRLPDEIFDYQAKYTDGVAEFVVPASLPEELAKRAQQVSLQAHDTLGCSGYSRVDLRLAEDGTPIVLEVNTLPGMTPISDLPRAAAAAGIPYEDLVERMLQTAQSGGE